MLFPNPLQHEPIHAKWDEIRDSITQNEDEFHSLLSGHEDSITLNQKINDRKVWFTKITSILLRATVTLALLTVLIGYQN